MENTNIDALMYLSKWCVENRIQLDDDLKKNIAKMMFYYAKDCTNNSTNRLSDSDIEQVNNENKIILKEIDAIKSSLNKMNSAQDIVNKLTS